jgi:putative transposase
MPGRKVPLITNQFYHVLNRGVGSQPIFLNKRDYQRMWESAFYYQNKKPVLSYSHFLRLPTKQRDEFLERLQAQSKFLVEIIALCLLPNHFHLLLKQVKDNGISLFMANLTNSYTRYFNTKNERIGHLFQGKFKAVMIETDEQLLHVSRYIHLNPYSSYLVRNLNKLDIYSYSSLPEYLGISSANFFQKEIILDQFKNISAYKKFVFDQAGYQRSLEQIKHLALER